MASNLDNLAKRNSKSQFDYTKINVDRVLQEIWEQTTDNNHLTKGLGNFIYNNSKHLPRKNTRKTAFEIAKKIASKRQYNRNKIKNNILEEFNGEKNLLKKAVENGNIWKFKLEEPWHPYLFLSGRLVTFPWQHEKTILYHGTHPNRFFSREEKPSKKAVDSEKRGLTDPGSVITQGILEGRQDLSAPNNWSDDSELGKLKRKRGEKMHTYTDGKFLSFISFGPTFRINLEVIAPSDKVYMMKGAGIEKGSINSLNGAIEKFTPSEMREKIGDSPEFVIPNDIPKEWINGVKLSKKGVRELGLEKSNIATGKFYPFQKFVKEFRASEKAPSKKDRSKRQLEKDYRSIRNILKVLKNDQDPLKLIEDLKIRLAYLDAVKTKRKEEFLYKKYSPIVTNSRDTGKTLKSLIERGLKLDKNINSLNSLVQISREVDTNGESFEAINKVYNRQIDYLKQNMITETNTKTVEINSLYSIENLQSKLLKLLNNGENKLLKEKSRTGGIKREYTVLEEKLEEFQDKFDDYLQSHSNISYEKSKELTEKVAEIENNISKIPKINIKEKELIKNSISN